MDLFSSWANFYVIVGSSAGALIGLQFVVMTLVASRPTSKGQEVAGAAFGTPVVLHFASVLLVSAVVVAPWRGINSGALVLGLIGTCGVIYSVIVAQRIRRQHVYKPEFADWMSHVILPFTSYLILSIAAFATQTMPHGGLFGCAAGALLLLFNGIYNAWDAVTYHIYTRPSPSASA
jgi:hypothetical protein